MNALSRRVALLRIAKSILTLPAALFWRFAALASRVDTKLENEEGGE